MAVKSCWQIRNLFVYLNYVSVFMLTRAFCIYHQNETYICVDNIHTLVSIVAKESLITICHTNQLKYNIVTSCIFTFMHRLVVSDFACPCSISTLKAHDFVLSNKPSYKQVMEIVRQINTASPQILKTKKKIIK